MFKWTSAPSGMPNPRKISIVHPPDDASAESFAMFHSLKGPTVGLRRLRSHLTVLKPGAGYAPHADDYDVGIVLLSGAVETLDRTIEATTTRGTFTG
jgi:hypothetical protein